MDYYSLLEQLIQTTNGKANQTDFREILERMRELLHISHGTTCFYPSMTHERMGQGEVLFIGTPPGARGRMPYGGGISPGAGLGGTGSSVVSLSDQTSAVFSKYEDCVISTEESFYKRTVAGGHIVIITSVWHDNEAPAWTDEERNHILTLTEVVQSYLIQSRLQMIVDHLTLFDNDDYPNLNYFFNQMGLMAEQGRLCGKAAVHLNLKHFANINRQLGRKAGDIVMRTYFGRLSGLVGGDGVACRSISANFVVLCGTATLDKLLDFFKSAPIVYDHEDNNRVLITATAGVYIIPNGFVFQSPGEIMDKIVAASNKAKYSSTSSVVYYDHSFTVDHERVSHLRNMLPMALENEEFKVYYQPYVDLLSGRLIGAEALCRWEHLNNFVQPPDFIPVLEHSGDIRKLDYYMLEHVCQDIRRWLDSGKDVMKVSVNFSNAHMMNMDLCRNIIGIVDKYNIPHHLIEIELTETTTEAGFNNLKRVVRDLRNAGCSASLEGFGKGYSSLNLIKEVDWNVLKIDRSFLPLNEDDDTGNQNLMFRSVISMAKELGFECVAVGVESRDQLRFLREYDCNIAQGFYFDRPMPGSEMEKRFGAHLYDVN
jgi:EAL domain-containing protein (putative c-di-GMP-specific phosphodiesterase class I)/GGDEF domain-containing protein